MTHAAKRPAQIKATTGPQSPSRVLGRIGVGLCIVVVGILASICLADQWGTVRVIIEVGSLFAVVLAILEMHRMRTVAGDISEQNDSMREIAGSMSTRYVGKFPDHLSEIILLLRSTKKSLRILCDVPGYCHFSVPREFLQYKAAIDLLVASGVRVEVAFLDKEHARKANEEQLGEWDVIRSSKAYENYVNFNQISEAQQPQTAEAFLNHLADNYDRHLDSFQMRPTKVHMVPRANLPMYFWIVDDRLAVFSFPSLSVQPPEVAFKTSDRDLLHIMERIWREATGTTEADNDLPPEVQIPQVPPKQSKASTPRRRRKEPKSASDN